MKKVALRKVLRDIRNTPVLAFRGYGTGKIFEDDLIDQHFEPSTNIEYWRNSRISVPGSLIGVDYPHAFETIEVDVEVHRARRNERTLRTGYEIKYQSTQGTAEDKIVASAHRLGLLIRARKLDRGFVVVGGDAWNALPLYMAASLHPRVEIVSEADLVRMAKRGVL